MSSDIIEVRGKEFMKSFQLREVDPELMGASRRIYCTGCYSILGVDHEAYEDNVFLNFPKHCENKGDLSAPLTAYVMMVDYTEEIGPRPLEGITFSTLIDQIGGTETLGLEKGAAI